MPAQQMRIAVLTLAGTAIDLLNERRLAADQQVEIAAKLIDGREARHAFASRQQFMSRLRAAQQQQAK
jgi:hypothetical protein